VKSCCNSSPDQQSSRSFATTCGHAGQAREGALLVAPAFRWMMRRPARSGKPPQLENSPNGFRSTGHRPLVVSTDVYRPAAREQLAQVAKAVGTANLAPERARKTSRNRKRGY